MPTSPIEPMFEAPSRLKTHFNVVPIEQVPVPDAAGGATADRPVVLVVNEDAVVVNTIVEILKQSGYAAIAAYDGKDALETALLVPPDVVIADVLLPDGNGVEVAAELKRKLPACKVVLMGSEQGATEAGASRLAELEFAVVEKPVQPATLLERVSASLKS